MARKEGETVAVGDPLVELETDKIDLEVAAPQAGVLKRIDRKDGEDVKVGEVLGVIEDAAAGAAAQAPAVAPSSSAPTSSQEKAAAPAPKAAGPEKTRATPAARKAAQEREVDLNRCRAAAMPGASCAGTWSRPQPPRVTAAPLPRLNQ